ncbi:hypothetical protein Tco_0998099 [Tanacetum coccineum]
MPCSCDRREMWDGRENVIVSLVVKWLGTGVVKPEIGGNVNFEIKSQFMLELREDTFSGNKNDDAHEHVERPLRDGWTNFHQESSIPGISLRKPLSKGTVHHQKPPSSLKKSATSSKKETRNYTKLGSGAMNRQLLDSQGPILGITRVQALTAIQTISDRSQKWHDGSSSRNIESSSSSEGIAAIEEVKRIEETKYGEFGQPSPFSNGAKYYVGPPGYYIRMDNRPPFGEKKLSLEEIMNKYMEESTRKRAEKEE